MDGNNKKKPRAISVESKRKIIKCVEDNPVKKIGHSTQQFSYDFKTKEKFDEVSVLCSKIRKIKSCELKDVEECVLKWLQQSHSISFSTQFRYSTAYNFTMF